MLRWKSSLKPAAASSGDNPGTTNLVNDWSMDETSGTRADSHGSANLTDNNTVTSATGVISNAASFNPANSEYLSSSTQPVTGTVARATECWFKTSYSGTDSQCITDYGAGSTGARWRIEIDNGGLVALRIFGATKIWDSSWNDGNWHHLVMQVAASSDCDDVEVYVDGTLDTSASGASATVSIDTGTGAQRIGIRSNTTKGFNGQIDEFRNWNRVLTSAEITWLYNSGSGRAYSDVSGGGPAGDALILNGVTNNNTGGVETSMRADGSSTVYGSYAIGNMDFRDASKNGSWTDDGLGCLWDQSTDESNWETLLGSTSGTFYIYEQGTSTLIFSFAWTGDATWSGTIQRYGTTSLDFTGTVPANSTRIDVYHVKD